MKGTCEVWIGLVEVVPRPGNKLLGSDQKGAWVNALAHAADAIDFRTQLVIELDRLGFKVVDVEDPEPFLTRIAGHQVSAEIRELAQKVKQDHDVGFDTFQTFPLS